MYTVSATYNTILADELHWYETQVKINNVVYSQSQIMEMSVNYRQFTEEYPVAGGCLSAELSLKMLTPSVQIPRMAKVEPFARITNGTLTSEWIPQGVFYIDTREQSQNDDNLPVMSLHCYDSMLKAEADYPETTHAWPYTDINVVNEIATAMGVSVDARTTALMTHGYSISLPAGYTMRETLGYIAAMYAGNFVMTYDGELLLIGLNSLPPETNYLVDNAGFAITFGRGETENVVSGAFVTFECDGRALDDLTATIGYDSLGRTGMIVSHAGKNIAKPSLTNGTTAGVTYTLNQDGSVTGVGTSTSSSSVRTYTSRFYLPVGVNFILSGAGSQIHLRINTQDANGTVKRRLPDPGTGLTFALREGEVSASVAIYTTQGTVVNETVYPMIRLASVESNTYEPYIGSAMSITFPAEAGMVYGGSLDVTTGVLISSLDSSGNPLPTPQTYQMASQSINSFAGINNIWADAGDVSVSYAYGGEVTRILV